MRRLLLVFVLIMTVITATSCTEKGQNADNTAVTEAADSKHILVAYFSATGNTAPLAEYAAEPSSIHLGWCNYNRILDQ